MQAECPLSRDDDKKCSPRKSSRTLSRNGYAVCKLSVYVLAVLTASAGELSCAECRRLKLKCDKKVPCGSCCRRGCESICPCGTLSGPHRWSSSSNDSLGRHTVCRSGYSVRCNRSCCSLLTTTMFQLRPRRHGSPAPQNNGHEHPDTPA